MKYHSAIKTEQRTYYNIDKAQKHYTKGQELNSKDYRHIVLFYLLRNVPYIIYSETDHQPRLDAWDKCSGLMHGEDSEGWGGEGGGRVDQVGEYM